MVTIGVLLDLVDGVLIGAVDAVSGLVLGVLTGTMLALRCSETSDAVEGCRSKVPFSLSFRLDALRID